MPATIVQNMDTIRLLFQEIKAFCEQETDLEILVARLDLCPNEFRSVAYESASMVLALRELKDGRALLNWTRFTQHPHAQHHLSQVYVGLGWAVAQEQVNFRALLEELPSFWGVKTADGAGYYDGIFRNRQTVRGLQIPSYMPEEALPVYYQGLGRSLWYLTKGNPTQAKHLLLTFPMERHSDLWLGIGLACAYVGGSDEPTLHVLLEEAGNDKRSLIIGGLLGFRSRLQAQSMTESAKLCIQVWSKKTVGLFHNLSIEGEDIAEESSNRTYFDYLKKVELSLVL